MKPYPTQSCGLLFAWLMTTLLSFAIAGCGGGGGEGSAAQAVPPAATSALKLGVDLIEVSSSEKGIATASWLPASEDSVIAATLAYEVHMNSPEGDFVPSTATLKFQGRAALSAKIEGLAGGRYTAKLVAQDANGQRVTSMGRVVTVPDSNSVINFGQQVVVLTSQQVSSTDLIAGTITLAAGSSQPAAGVVLASEKNGGILQRVVSSQVQADGSMKVSTQPVALNAVLSEFNFSSSVTLIPVPESTSSTQAGIAVMQSPSGAVSVNWPQSGFTLSSSEPRASLRASGVTGGLQAGLSGSSALLELSQQKKTESGSWGSISVPLLVGVLEGQPSRAQNFNLDIKLTDTSLEVCRIQVLSDGTAGRLADTVSQKIYLTTKDVAPGPYAVKVRVYLDKVGEKCNGDDWLGVWSATPEISIDVTVTSSSQLFKQERKTLSYSGGFSVSNAIDFQFDPRLEMEVKMPDITTVSSARFEVAATTYITQLLTINADGAAKLAKQSQRLIQPRKFTKVFLAAGVPVVIEGWFWLDVEIEGVATGKISASEELKIGFDKLGYGISYDAATNTWKPFSTFQPTYNLTVQGAADAKVTVQIALVPQMKVQIYRAPTARLTIRPYVEAEAGLHGQLLLNKNPRELTVDADIWLTKSELRGAIDAYFYAGLEVLNTKIVSYPLGASPDDYLTHKQISLLGSTTFISLPTLVAARLPDKHPDDARAILIRVTAEDLQSPFRRFVAPFGPESFMSFDGWHNPRVIVANDTGYAWIRPPNGATGETKSGRFRSKDFWLILDKTGDYRIRMGGYSEMGSWARQIANEISINHVEIITPPAITKQPASQSVNLGSLASFSVVATGTAPITYQWRKNGIVISSATAANYITPAAVLADNGSQYSVVITNSAGNVASAAASLTVTTAAITPTVATQPTSQGVSVGSTANFSVVAAGTAPFSYQWRKNGTVISGASPSSSEGRSMTCSCGGDLASTPP